jgi:hypothetical protein
MENTADARRGVSSGSRLQMRMHLLVLGNAGSAFYGSAYIMTLYETVFALYIGLGHARRFPTLLLWRSSFSRTCSKHQDGQASDAWFVGPVVLVTARAKQLPERPLGTKETTLVPLINDRSLSARERELSLARHLLIPLEPTRIIAGHVMTPQILDSGLSSRTETAARSLPVHGNWRVPMCQIEQLQEC